MRQVWRFPMQAQNVPSIDARYWLAIFFASLLGTTLGDFCAQELHLGFVSGLPIMAAILAVVLVAESRSKRATEAYYWTAIVITRTAATNLADLATHALKLEFLGVIGVLVALMVFVLVLGRICTRGSSRAEGTPSVDLFYWLAILLASTIGTAGGDFVAGGLGVLSTSMIATTSTLAVVLLACSRIKPREALFWLAIVLERIAGTNGGDFLASDNGLGLGHGWAAALSLTALVSLVWLWRRGASWRQMLPGDWRLPMQAQNVPVVDAKYWLAILIAAVLGTSLGYYICLSYLLDYINGLPYMALALVVVLTAENRSVRALPVFYWLTIVIAWAVGTDLAGLFTKRLDFTTADVTHVLTVMLAFLLLFGGRLSQDKAGQEGVPPVDLRYWLAILILSTLGAVMGDFVTQQLGYVQGTYALVGVIAVIWLLGGLCGLNQAVFWLTVLVARAAGTTGGDYLSGAAGFTLGYAYSSAIAALALVLLLRFWRSDTTWSGAGRGLFVGGRTVVRLIVRFRRMLCGLAAVGFGVWLGYFGYTTVLPLQSPQHVQYNTAIAQIHTDFGNKLQNWSQYVSPEVPELQKSIMYYKAQAKAGLLDRLLYGKPDAALAAQANLKIGVILLYNAGSDDKLLNEAKGYLEEAVRLNPGIPYAQELLAGSGTLASVNNLALMALAPERDLEMLYQSNPQNRTPKPQKGDGKGKGDADKQGDQKGQPDQPNDQPGDPNDKKSDQQGQASKNTTLQQNMQDVNNGVGNDGI
jgi:uncharacterized membrane-anchored protein